MVTACSHGLENILDHQYVPRTVQDRDLFREQPKFAFSVLEQQLQTDMGKTLVLNPKLRQSEVGLKNKPTDCCNGNKDCSCCRKLLKQMLLIVRATILKLNKQRYVPHGSRKVSSGAGYKIGFAMLS